MRPAFHATPRQGGRSHARCLGDLLIGPLLSSEVVTTTSPPASPPSSLPASPPSSPPATPPLSSPPAQSPPSRLTQAAGALSARARGAREKRRRCCIQPHSSPGITAVRTDRHSQVSQLPSPVEARSPLASSAAAPEAKTTPVDAGGRGQEDGPARSSRKRNPPRQFSALDHTPHLFNDSDGKKGKKGKRSDGKMGKPAVRAAAELQTRLSVLRAMPADNRWAMGTVCTKLGLSAQNPARDLKSFANRVEEAAADARALAQDPAGVAADAAGAELTDAAAQGLLDAAQGVQIVEPPGCPEAWFLDVLRMWRQSDPVGGACSNGVAHAALRALVDDRLVQRIRQRYTGYRYEYDNLSDLLHHNGGHVRLAMPKEAYNLALASCKLKWDMRPDLQCAEHFGIAGSCTNTFSLHRIFAQPTARSMGCNVCAPWSAELKLLHLLRERFRGIATVSQKRRGPRLNGSNCFCSFDISIVLLATGLECVVEASCIRPFTPYAIPAPHSFRFLFPLCRLTAAITCIR